MLEDNLTTPSGIAYVVAARGALLARLRPEQPPRSLDPVVGMLAATLRSAAPESGEPSIVVLTDGPDNSAAWEHEWLARALDVPLVLPSDLRTSGDRLLHGGEPVDVVYRRTNADRVDTDVGALLLPRAARRHARRRQRVRHDGRRRQARARLRRGHGALLPGRGAAAALGRDVRPGPPGGPRARARPARRPRREAAQRLRRARHRDLPARRAARTSRRSASGSSRPRTTSSPSRWSRSPCIRP